ncbi:GNAT family N-acetyltransferase [Sphingomonas arantia]|uniref:GNAT family N-acetyltransferase n=1 Tax=Sphingomonas arantia TaxID=1460676 RepID=A0ABW4TX83_9SPHN
MVLPDHGTSMTTVPLGPIVPEATRPLPAFELHRGRVVTLEPLSGHHAGGLWDAARSADVSWAYLKYGPFPTEADLAAHLGEISGLEQQPYFAVIPASSGKPEGWASFCDIAPHDAAIEIGSIWFSPRLQRTRAATEAIFLMMQHAFELGYHRVVWRCNALNAASMRAARRFGFTHEGTWRGDGIVKGHRRDTAWFSILETEWPIQRARFDAWLDDRNFDANGVAIHSLSRES